MTNKIDATSVHEVTESLESKLVATEPGAGKKRFVEPEITVSVDILEATTFFQVATSGATN